MPSESFVYGFKNDRCPRKDEGERTASFPIPGGTDGLHCEEIIPMV